jgi:hypothetical protein
MPKARTKTDMKTDLFEPVRRTRILIIQNSRKKDDD